VAASLTTMFLVNGTRKAYPARLIASMTGGPQTSDYQPSKHAAWYVQYSAN
jgi:hypothetical protein